jgi:hypothetical protein
MFQTPWGPLSSKEKQCAALIQLVSSWWCQCMQCRSTVMDLASTGSSRRWMDPPIRLVSVVMERLECWSQNDSKGGRTECSAQLHEQSKKGKASISVVSRREFVMSRHALLKRVEAVLLTHTCSAGAGADADADEEDMHIAGPSLIISILCHGRRWSIVQDSEGRCPLAPQISPFWNTWGERQKLQNINLL